VERDRTQDQLPLLLIDAAVAVVTRIVTRGTLTNIKAISSIGGQIWL
jgi:hypothetical protein